MANEPFLVGSWVNEDTGEGLVRIEIGDKPIYMSIDAAIAFAFDVIMSAEEAETNSILYEFGKTQLGNVNEAGRSLVNFMQEQRAKRRGQQDRIRDVVDEDDGKAN